MVKLRIYVSFGFFPSLKSDGLNIELESNLTKKKILSNLDDQKENKSI